MSHPTHDGAIQTNGRPAEASEADTAILRTLLYADIFNYPLTADEVHHFLIGSRLPREQVRRALEASPWLAERTVRLNGYFAARGRGEVAALREQREQSSRNLWPAARRYARWVGQLPFVRMVAVTGALAMNNSEAGDDIDFLVVTAPGRVWLARALCVGLVKLTQNFGSRLCPNYVLAETALEQQRQDLFTAHEVAQMAPVVGHALYERMRQANAWSFDYLPNAEQPLQSQPDAAPRGLGLMLQRFFEWVLGGRLGERLEAWERRRKLAKFRPQAEQETSHAVLDPEHVKGHFRDYGRLTMLAYEQRLQVYGVEGLKASSASPAGRDKPGGRAGTPG